MLDPNISKTNKMTMNADELGAYFDRMTGEVDSYIYGGNKEKVETKDFMFDAMSLIAWSNTLALIDVEMTPFQPIGQIQSTVHEKKKLRQIGKLARDVMTVQNKINQPTFLRTDVTCSAKTLQQFHDGNMYPGLRRGHIKQDRVVVDDEIRIAQYLSPNPQYIFHVQFFYPTATYHSYRVNGGQIEGSESHRDLVQTIIDRFSDLNIRPRHPQYNEHGTQDIAFEMTIVDAPNGPEVFAATAYGLIDGREKPVFKL
ncbi:hypothetical protein AU106_gp225 [Sinorhizobium phage phiM9]|uniref:Uncharacterized protein n=1 Tax=Sinorhizobium phage phiM9 TaxID=1636182 RepID=A0A0F6THM4_9CAUD|nr:hypothetical protein AU106_gp225 [Sinorhizobium phage phiM9]AKE44856.1 hypothetical protein Sm_phiM9_229 [Sinorhizobium phage phiM9]